MKEEDTKKESFIYKRILQKLEEKKMPRHQQIEITGLSEKEIKEILHGEEVKVVPPALNSTSNLRLLKRNFKHFGPKKSKK